MKLIALNFMELITHTRCGTIGQWQTSLATLDWSTARFLTNADFVAL